MANGSATGGGAHGSTTVAFGAMVWNTEHGCSGRDGTTPVLYRGWLYTHVTDWGSPFLGSVFDAASGSLVQRVRLDEVPAFSGHIGVFPFRGDDRADQIGHTLTVRDLSTNRVRWRFRGDGYLDCAPLIRLRHRLRRLVQRSRLQHRDPCSPPFAYSYSPATT